MSWARLKTSATLRPYYGEDVYAEARGTEYAVEWYEDRDNYGVWEAALVIHAHRVRDRKRLWSGTARIGSADTMRDAIREARLNR